MDDDEIDAFMNRIIIFVVALFAVIFVVSALSGCATAVDSAKKLGIEAKPEEMQACSADGCSVWTDEELERAFIFFYKKGYAAGVSSI